MNMEQLEEQVQKNSRDITALKETAKSAHKRIDGTDALVAQLHKLAISVETLAYQVKSQNEKIGAIVEGQQNQGERIGTLEKKPGIKWETLSSQITALAVAAVFGAIIAKII